MPRFLPPLFFLAITVIAVGYLAISLASVSVPPTPIPTPTPWGTPPWADRWVVTACSLRDTNYPTPDANKGIHFDATNTVCYDLPPEDIAWQIVEAASVWGIWGGQVTRCKSPTECAVEAGGKCYIAKWYPQGHQDWPQGGWVFGGPLPPEFRCRPVPWSIAYPYVPYGTPTPTPRATPIGLP